VAQAEDVESLVSILQANFGTEDQAERFRAELRARRRKPGETLQVLYQDVCRLLALAFPGPNSEARRLVGRDAFLDALNDNELRIRILEWAPQDLRQAMSLACRFEAYRQTAPSDGRSVPVTGLV